MSGARADKLVTRFREASSSGWTITTTGRYEPYVVVGYHRLAEDAPAVNVRLYPDSHPLAARVFHGDKEESFTDVEAANQYVEELLKTLPEEGN